MVAEPFLVDDDRITYIIESRVETLFVDEVTEGDDPEIGLEMFRHRRLTGPRRPRQSYAHDSITRLITLTT